MAQNGSIVKHGRYWVLRFWERKTVNGVEVSRRAHRKLAPVSREYPTESSVTHLAQEILAPVNAVSGAATPTETVRDFAQRFLLHCEQTKKPSTANGYASVWNVLKPHVPAALEVSRARTVDIGSILRAVAAEPKHVAAEDRGRGTEELRGRRTLGNCRNFLSGLFRYAINCGLRDSNPVREVETPRGVAPKKTYAYSLPEIQTILAALPNEPTHTLVLAAALTGLRRSELAGLKWEDVDFERKTISVRRAIWNGIASETKTEESEAEIPMVPLLAEALAEHKARNGFKSWCFHGETGNPLVIANVTRREIEPALEKAGIAWEGWHAFRRGVATNLHALGVPDKEIQSILRHSDVSITQKAYIKPDEKTKQGAMQQLQDAFRAAEVRP